MTSSTRALLARLDIYRNDEEQPKPLSQLPQPHPPISLCPNISFPTSNNNNNTLLVSSEETLTRRMALSSSRVNALKAENNELYIKLEEAQSIATRRLPSAISPLLGYQNIINECSHFLDVEELYMRETLVNTLEKLYALKSFSNFFDDMHVEYIQLKKEGIQLVFENYIGDISLEKARTISTEILVRFEFLNERLSNSVDEYANLQRFLSDAIGVTVSRTIIYMGRSGKEKNNKYSAIFNALQEVVMSALSIASYIEEDLSIINQNSNNNNNKEDILIKKLHAISVGLTPQQAALSMGELKAMADENKYEPNKNRHNYDSIEKSLRAAMALLN